MRIKKLALLLLLLLLTHISFAGNLTGAQVIAGNNTQKSQLILQLTSPFKYHYFFLNSPDRLVVDFDNTGIKDLNDIFSKTHLGQLPIRSVRTSVSAAKTLRVVFDLNYGLYNKRPLNALVHLSQLAASGNQPWRLNITFEPMNQTALSAVQKTAPKLLPNPVFKPVIKAPVKVTPPQKTSAPTQNAKAKVKPKMVIIVIDPGHGGKDPGAHGNRYHTLEKNVVLGISRQLQYLINQQKGMHAVLTRSGDYFVDLRQRLKIARKNSADLFVSIHADAFNDSYSHGASVYALSQRGGTSEAARWLAAKENYSELGGVDLGDLDDTNGMVRSVLIDLSQTATIGASLDLGQGVLRNMGQMTRLHHRTVEQAQFVVLKSLDIPSILVETGFISNPQEEANLRDPKYQAQLARAILYGIQAYLKQHPSTGAYAVGGK